MFHYSVQSGTKSGWRGGPHHEYRIDAIEAPVQRLWKSEISLHHVHLWWQVSQLRSASQRTDMVSAGLMLHVLYSPNARAGPTEIGALSLLIELDVRISRELAVIAELDHIPVAVAGSRHAAGNHGSVSEGH